MRADLLRLLQACRECDDHPELAAVMARSSGSAELQRPSEILHQGHARGSVAMRANDVVDPVALPVDEHMSNVCTLAMPSGSFNQGTVGRTSVDRGGRSEHSERCESHAAYARSRTAIA